jgi:hypothetical protein
MFRRSGHRFAAKNMRHSITAPAPPRDRSRRPMNRRSKADVARDLSESHVRSKLGLERAWAAAAGAGAIKNGPAIVHRPGRPEKLTLRADVEVALPIEGEVGARQDAFFALAHVPNRMCGVMPVPITQWRNLPVPYAVSAASRSGLSPSRCSVRLIIVFVAATSS